MNSKIMKNALLLLLVAGATVVVGAEPQSRFTSITYVVGMIGHAPVWQADVSG